MLPASSGGDSGPPAAWVNRQGPLSFWLGQSRRDGWGGERARGARVAGSRLAAAGLGVGLGLHGLASYLQCERNY